MEVDPKENILQIFDDRISSIVVDANAELVETDEDGKPIDAAKVDIEKQFKRNPDERLYPVFIENI